MQSVESYIVTLDWQKLQSLAWERWPWAKNSEEATIKTWATACDLEELPLCMTRALLLIDTALVQIWDGAGASLPSLDRYPSYLRSRTSDKKLLGKKKRVHHEAWLPLALILGVESYADYRASASPTEIERHFTLSAGVTQPDGPLPNPDAAKTLGTYTLANFIWEVGFGTSWCTIFPWPFTTGIIAYSPGWMWALVDPHDGTGKRQTYSARWTYADGKVHHLVLANQGKAENTSNGLLTPVSTASTEKPSNYGAVRVRNERRNSKGQLELSTPLLGKGVMRHFGMKLVWRPDSS